uniref:G protein-coupled receptor n=1 Tax=Caenorhabditis tropicalis TaxID=1561998 RepID=A0A1I7UV98_9PELO
MHGYKYCLCYMQGVSFLTEIYMSWICPGYYFFPMVGGYNTGEFFGQFISSHLSMSIWVGIFCFELASGLSCFVYRHTAAAQINQNYPQCLKWMMFDGFEAYDYKLNPMLAVTGIGAFAYVFCIAWYCFFLGIHTMIILQRLRQHMSSQTYNMHRAALISLAMQLAIPGVFIIVPIDLCMTVVVTESYGMQEWATNSMFMVGSHSMCQCTVMILSNATYRRILREKAWRVLKLDVLISRPYGSSIEPSMRTNSMLAAFLTETHMSWICPGYYFFPLVGGYNTGEFFGQFISSHLKPSLDYTFLKALNELNLNIHVSKSVNHNIEISHLGLLYFQLAAFLTETHMSWICPAYYFFPLVGGYNTGEFFGQFIGPHLSFSLWVGVYAFELSGGLCCFVYRHNAAVQINQNYASRTYIKKIALVLVHIFPFQTAICMYLSGLTYQEKYDYVRKNYPQCLKWMMFDGFEAYDRTTNPMIVITGGVAFVFVFIIVWYCFTLGVHTMVILQRLRQHMSAQTYNMHRAAIASLTMQLVLPGSLIIIPKNIILYIVLTDSNHLQEVATDMMFLMGSHSMCQCTVMILSNSVYRRIIKEKIGSVLRINFLTNQQYGSSVEPSMRTNSFIRAQMAPAT